MKSRAFEPFRALALLSFTIVAAAACSTNVTNNPADPGGSSGSTPVPVADCTSRCEAKATKCGAPSAQGKEACSGICDGSYTSDQLACLEDKSCSELKSGSFSNVCPRSSSSSSGGSNTSGGSSTSGGSGTTHFSCSLNGACYKCADSAGVSKCSITSGPGPGCTSTDPSYCE